MEWIERLNQALDYIENHLTEEMDYGEAARVACCSTYHFQRMFSYLANMPLAEYVRRRRMSLAAVDLCSGMKVLDAALKYGYESPTAFNRAFQAVHGLPPSQAKAAGAILKAYPPISFQITIKGDTAMDYRIEEKEAFQIVGYSAPMSQNVEENFAEVPKLWQRVADPATMQGMLALMDIEPKGVLGVSAAGEGEEWRYFIAVASSQPAPQGMDSLMVPACTWAIFPGSGTMPESIQELEQRIITQWLPTSGYEYAEAPDVELYLNADPQNAQFEVWLPVRKAK